MLLAEERDVVMLTVERKGAPRMAEMTCRDSQVRAAQVELLYRNDRAGHCLALLGGGILAIAQAAHIAIPVLLMWCVALLAVTALRAVWSSLYWSARPSPHHAALFGRRCLLGAALSGAVWGAAAFLLFPHDAVAHQVLLAFVLTTVTAIAAAEYAPSLPVFALFAVLLGVPLSLRFLLAEGELHTTIAVFSLLFTLGMGLLVRNVGRSIRAGLTLGADNQVLKNEITRRQEAEQALRLSEQKFRDYAEAAADWFWETDSELHFSYVSSSPYRDLLGPSLVQLCATPERTDWPWYSAQPAQTQRPLSDLRARRPFRCLSFRRQQADGSVVVSQLTGTPVFDPEGHFAGYRGAGIDISEAYCQTERLVHEATHDALTGAVNRREFESRLRRTIASVSRHGADCVLCFLDLDRFKHVNDGAGHQAGDQLLRELTALMRSKLRKRDTLARLGGDEFALLLQGCPTEKAVELAQSIVNELRQFRFAAATRPFQIGVSVGIVPITKAAMSPDALLNHAEVACYAAKRRGGNQIQVHGAAAPGLRVGALPPCYTPAECRML